MLVFACLILNLFIAFYFSKKKLKDISNVYLIFIALMGLMSLFYIDVYEIQYQLRLILGESVYRDLTYIVTGRLIIDPYPAVTVGSIVGFTPLFALELASFVLFFIVALSIAVDIIKKVKKARVYFRKPCNSTYIPLINNKLVVKFFDLYCEYLC